MNPRFLHNKTRFRAPLTLSLFLISLTFAVIAFAPRSGAKRAVMQEQTAVGKRTRPPYVPGEVLVRYRSEKIAKAQTRTATVLSTEGRGLSIQVERVRASDLVEGLRLGRVAPEDTMAAIEALKQQPDVLYAEPNYILHVDATPNDTRFSELYGMTKIGAPQAWDTTTGSTNVVIGVVDEGVDINHPDLTPTIWNNPSPGSISGITDDLHGYNFVDNTGTIPAEDHATHVAGIAGARGNNGVGVVGVNWTVSLM